MLKNEEEVLVSSNSTFLTQKKLQALVYSDSDIQEPQALTTDDFQRVDQKPFEIKENDKTEKKQAIVKVLDFDWVVRSKTKQNQANESADDVDQVKDLLEILAKTPNDNVFSTSHVRVMIEFMWEKYYEKILHQLFVPYCLFFVSFHL